MNDIRSVAQKAILVLAMASFLFWPELAGANRIIETKPLQFGTIAISGAFPQEITISPYGAETHSAGITPLRGYSNGVFEITELTPGTIFTVTISDTTITGLTGIDYDVTDFMFAPDVSSGQSPADGVASAQADGVGNLSLRIGAKLSIQNGTIYAPGAYRGTYQLVLNF